MKFKCFVLLFIAAFAGFTSCKNNDNYFVPVVATGFTVVNASADTLNFYLNGTRQNNTSSLFPRGALVNAAVPSGQENFQFKKAGAADVLFSVPLTLTKNTYNSLYIAGETSDKAFSTLDTLLLDTVKNICTVRFVNAAPDAGNLNALVGDTVNFKTRAFKTSSVFLPVGSGLKHIRIYQTGAAVAKVDTVITMQPNRVYTLFTKGLLNGKGSSGFNVGVILNY